ncbi:DUF3710 domain-containing protein [Virgisporangium ochraceum]|uniref:DUF3710 domain-containing protein n=1 Tax=Virgisporangium ochraceum TaxID=65505 RepID=A0A8J4ECB8_9ACTN|nr:hypothetical protein Voc01_044530 [Virgisporangium ochraceum]
MIFSRKRDSGRHAAPRRERDEVAQYDDVEDVVDDDDAEQGPWDISDAPDGFGGLDLGSLHVPVPKGVELRVQADPDGQIQQVLLASGESVLQLGVFAAPRSEGIWDEVREDIRKQLFSDGVAAEDGTGEYGPELRARVRTPDGLTDIRFVGVDGPRWMVRAVYQGPAATDPTAAAPLDAVLHGLVVDRGGAAMPVREPLPLTLPKDLAEQAQAQQAAADPVEEAAPAEPRKPAPAGRGGQAGTRRRPSPRPRRG